jgi:hypothetical protein
VQAKILKSKLLWHLRDLEENPQEAGTAFAMETYDLASTALGCTQAPADAGKMRGCFSPIQRRSLKMAKVMKSTDSSSLAEVVDRILDKGIVIDAWVKVSLVGIELLSIEARVVIASVETYLKYAEAIGLTATAAAPA